MESQASAHSLKSGSSQSSKKDRLYDQLLSQLEEDFGLSPNDQVFIPGGVIISGTPEEEEAQYKEIEARLMRKYGRMPRGTMIIIGLSRDIKIIE
jgi:hypothetical protein